MADFWTNFVKNHGERLIYMSIAMCIATLLYNIELKEAASVIYIGCGMMCYNKSRGSVEKKIE